MVNQEQSGDPSKWLRLGQIRGELHGDSRGKSPEEGVGKPSCFFPESAQQKRRTPTQEFLDPLLN